MADSYTLSIDRDECRIYLGHPGPDTAYVSWAHCTFEQALNEATLKLKDQIHSDYLTDFSS